MRLKKGNPVDMTLDYYNKNAEEFNHDTAHVEFNEIHNMFLKYLNPASHILDLGCGSGRDSLAFIKNGYKLTAMDGSSEMCKIASKNIGQEVICREFKDLNEDKIFDGIWACASIIHLPTKELSYVMGKILKALKVGGYIYASFKYGDFEGEINGRYFTYFKEDTLKAFLKDFNELKIIEIQITRDARVGREDEKWLNIVLEKI